MIKLHIIPGRDYLHEALITIEAWNGVKHLCFWIHDEKAFDDGCTVLRSWGSNMEHEMEEFNFRLESIQDHIDWINENA